MEGLRLICILWPVVAMIAVSQAQTSAMFQVAGSGSRPGPDVCQREAPALTGGVQPILVRGKAQKKVRDVRPEYPKLPPNMVFGGGVWIGEVLVDRVGKVAHVWTVRPVEFTPPFPQFNAAIIDAVQQWEFVPVRVDEEPMPFCMTVTVTTKLR